MSRRPEPRASTRSAATRASASCASSARARSAAAGASSRCCSLVWIAGSIALLVVAHLPRLQRLLRPAGHGLGRGEPRRHRARHRAGLRRVVPARRSLADEPASDEQRRVTVVVEQGATDTSIGQLLFDEGLISSEVAFQYAVINSGREGTLAAGTFDLSPTLRPSEIVAALQGAAVRPDDERHDPRRAPPRGGRRDLRARAR